MADWQTVRFDPSYPEPLDPEVIPLCDALNAAGFVTTSSCSGHGTQWAHIYFEPSSDERIERMARAVIATESHAFPAETCLFSKEILPLPEAYLWCLEVIVHNVYSGTPWEEALAMTGAACERVAKAINDWAKAETPPTPVEQVTLPCPGCGNPESFGTIKGYCLSPIVCAQCHALLEISGQAGEWAFTVIDRPEPMA
jgi:hypothetical protein